MAETPKIPPPELGWKWRAQWHRGPQRSQVEVHNDGKFDELVVDGWFHLEQMDDNLYWVKVGDHVLNVHKADDGTITVTHEVDP